MVNEKIEKKSLLRIPSDYNLSRPSLKKSQNNLLIKAIKGSSKNTINTEFFATNTYFIYRRWSAEPKKIKH